MEYRLSIVEDAQAVTDVVQITEESISPHYYPKEVVYFFAGM